MDTSNALGLFHVLTICETYNHEAFISNAMDGFVMQQTTFPVVSVIIDDASTDHTANVIRHYVEENFDLQDFCVACDKDMDFGHVTFARHRNNENCYFAVILLNENHYQRGESKESYYAEWASTKYIALCEGDDYWTDPLKLQKQVDFLEAHPDFSMCIHGADVKNESSREVWAKCETIETREYFSKDVFPEWVVPTASIVYRRKEVDGYLFKHYDWVVASDIVLILKGTHTGRVWGMEEHMSVYRMNDGSFMAKAINETVESRTAMCRHYQVLMMNFPQVDKDYCNHYIASFNYSRFRLEKKWSKKLEHLYVAIKASPKYVLKKFLRIR